MTDKLGLKRGAVLVVAYDRSWPRAFELEKCELQTLLGATAMDIQHIGSTSVEKLPAKPIIDVMVGVRSLPLTQSLFVTLSEAGYQYRANGPEGQVLFAKGSEERRTHYIHFAEYGGPFWKDHLLFRNYLGDNPGETQRYGELKRRLASQYPTTREQYTAAKQTYVEGVVARAKARSLPE